MYAWYQNNSAMPNLVVKGPYGSFDITATFAGIEKSFGSNTVCDETEQWRRRVEKERLKLECVRYALAGPEEGDTEKVAESWLLPVFPSYREEAYTLFSD